MHDTAIEMAKRSGYGAKWRKFYAYTRTKYIFSKKSIH